jgi:hypothetical protein
MSYGLGNWHPAITEGTLDESLRVLVQRAGWGPPALFPVSP